MKLVVGLGNPGRKYQETRHNIGFLVLAELAERYAASRPKGKFQGELSEIAIGGQKVALLAPTTFMNRSGASVGAAFDFYKLELADLLVICDDLNLPLAKLRLRAQGSSGGQKGLNDIIRRLGTDEFARLRIGIGEVPDGWDAADFVLSKFDKTEKAEIAEAVGRAADAVACWVTNDISETMNRFN
ncbi:MAG: aminoacyl-tRNA hydrolase [Planctomycetia bacterium]